MTKKSRQKIKYLENKKSFWDKIKNIFLRSWRAASCQNLSRTLEYAFNDQFSGVIGIVFTEGVHLQLNSQIL